tara:strand:- start:49 stop:267 length:219 start_codon:yes stop_codon:yes gene_type:complete
MILPRNNGTAIWLKCECCDEYMCNIHNVHVHDCTCPGIDVMSEHFIFPYDDPVSDAAIKIIEANPFKDEDDD